MSNRHGNIDNILGWSAPHIHFATETLRQPTESAVNVIRVVGNCRHNIMVKASDVRPTDQVVGR